jgi:hypothetical protein
VKPASAMGEVRMACYGLPNAPVLKGLSSLNYWVAMPGVSIVRHDIVSGSPSQGIL